MYYEGFEKDYTEVVQTILSTFSSNEIGMISLGTLTFIKPAIKSLRSLGIPSKVLQIPMANAAGKFSYSMEIKEKIFSTVWNAFTLWHEVMPEINEETIELLNKWLKLELLEI